MAECADLELRLHRKDERKYQVDFCYSQPDSEADTRLDAEVSFDQDPQTEWQYLPAEEYAQEITKSFFRDEKLSTSFAQACTSAQASHRKLRLRLFIDPTLSELHALRWELLRHPQQGFCLATNEQILFSRYLASPDWRPLRAKSKGELQALVVVAGPSDLASKDFKPVEVEKWVACARTGLGPELPPRLLPEGNQRATLENLVSTLRETEEDIEILCLVCHGYLNPKGPILILENDDGTLKEEFGQELVMRLAELTNRPRLVVLISCESGGNPMSALGPELARIGIPAIVAMQDTIRMETAAKFLPEFLKNLLNDGSIDRAVAVARSTIQNEPDYWVPVLYTRLKQGQLWYAAGFSEDKGMEKWPALLRKMNKVDEMKEPGGGCTPILGPGLLERYIGTLRDLAQRWADSFQPPYPLAPYDRDSLAQVAQYRFVNQDYDTAQGEWLDRLRQAIQQHCPLSESDRHSEVNPSLPAPVEKMLKAARAQFISRGKFEPHSVLAKLPVRVFLTANMDELLEEALRSENKTPTTMLSPWKMFDKQVPRALYLRDDKYVPSVEYPLVYHLFGIYSQPQSLVLTEDDTFKFLIGFTSNSKSIPAQVGRALTDSALLFIGFNSDDWNFRILQQCLLAKEGSTNMRDYPHISAQIEPEEDRLLDPRRALRYLEQYYTNRKNTAELEINIYWGNACEFLAELSSQWLNYKKTHPNYAS